MTSIALHILLLLIGLFLISLGVLLGIRFSIPDADSKGVIGNLHEWVANLENKFWKFIGIVVVLLVISTPLFIVSCGLLVWYILLLGV